MSCLPPSHPHTLTATTLTPSHPHTFTNSSSFPPTNKKIPHHNGTHPPTLTPSHHHSPPLPRHPPHGKLSNSITFPLFPERDTPVDLNIKAYVGNPNSSQFHVFEAVRPLTRFALYLPCSLSVEPQPAGSVVFHLSERLERVREGGREGGRVCVCV